MLVLSRKKDERITIGDNVTITIVEISGDRVRIGFDAPRDIQIWREEINGKASEEGGSDGRQQHGVPRSVSAGGMEGKAD